MTSSGSTSVEEGSSLEVEPAFVVSLQVAPLDLQLVTEVPQELTGNVLGESVVSTVGQLLHVGVREPG